MFRKFSVNLDDMALAIILWICTLPLVGLFVFPFFGLKTSLVVATGLLIAVLFLCWGICSSKIFHS